MKMKKFDLSKIMKRAWELVKKAGMSISSGLKKAWEEAKNMCETAKNVVIGHFYDYNARRYSLPWVCLIDEQGKHDFSQKVGAYSANHGEEGDLIVFEPVIGQVYGFGQKDYRGGYNNRNTVRKIAKWTGTEFVECDKFGNIK